MLRVQVLNHDKRHAGGGDSAKELTERFEASGRGTDSHDKEGRAATGGWHPLSIGRSDGYHESADEPGLPVAPHNSGAGTSYFVGRPRGATA